MITPFMLLVLCAVIVIVLLTPLILANVLVSLPNWRRRAWHWAICRPWFSGRKAWTRTTADLMAGFPVCSCGKVTRRG